MKFVLSSHDEHHVLHSLLPDERQDMYNLRDRRHNRELKITSRLINSSFLTRQLFRLLLTLCLRAC